MCYAVVSVSRVGSIVFFKNMASLQGISCGDVCTRRGFRHVGGSVFGRVAYRTAARCRYCSTIRSIGSMLACMLSISPAVVRMAPVMMMAACRCMDSTYW